MHQHLDDLLPLGQLPAGARVIDLGCGGATVPYQGFPHLRFIGMDEFAHRETNHWPANASLLLGRAESLPLADATIDAALCNFVFEHLHEPRAAIRELQRVLRPGGLLYISIPRSSSLQDRLYRFTTKGGGHLQRYSFQRFIEIVYQETAFKLEGVAPAPAAFTWLNQAPAGDLVRELLVRGARVWLRATGRNVLASSDYLLLFRLGDQPGFVSIRHVCSHCGCWVPKRSVNAASWVCANCYSENFVVCT